MSLKLNNPNRPLWKKPALEEVIVTANRREQNLQDVAISVAAFTDEFFKNTGTKNLKQLEQYTPSLKIAPVTDSRSTSIRIRGIGSVGSNAGIDPKCWSVYRWCLSGARGHERC